MGKLLNTWMRLLNATMLVAMLVGMPIGCGALPAGILPDGTASIDTESASPAANTIEASASSPADACLGLGTPSDDIHQAILDNLNNFRVANGLPPLAYSATLQAAADAHVRDLYERDFFAHINPDGKNPGQRAVATGFCHKYVGENIAAGQKSANSAQIAWENSPSHRENMLSTGYKYAGVGFYQDPNGRMYWAQEMAYSVP